MCFMYSVWNIQLISVFNPENTIYELHFKWDWDCKIVKLFALNRIWMNRMWAKCHTKHGTNENTMQIQIASNRFIKHSTMWWMRFGHFMQNIQHKSHNKSFFFVWKFSIARETQKMFESIAYREKGKTFELKRDWCEVWGTL